MSKNYRPLAPNEEFLGHIVSVVGDGVTLTTDFYDNGDGVPNGIFMNQRLTMDGTFNSTHFDLCGALMCPETLRRIATEIEKAEDAIVNKRRHSAKSSSAFECRCGGYFVSLAPGQSKDNGVRKCDKCGKVEVETSFVSERL